MGLAAISAQAQDNDGADIEDLRARVNLAQRMAAYLPVAPQVESAVRYYVDHNLHEYSDDQRKIIERALLNAMNPQALETNVVDAYAQTYTRDELAAMVAYYQTPEAQSALKKQSDFEDMLRPKIIEALDSAVMKLRSAHE